MPKSRRWAASTSYELGDAWPALRSQTQPHEKARPLPFMIRAHRAIRPLIFVLSLGLGGCVEQESRPSTPELMTGPELSHPREPRSTDEPPPPMHEDLKRT